MKCIQGHLAGPHAPLEASQDESAKRRPISVLPFHLASALLGIVLGIGGGSHPVRSPQFLLTAAVTVAAIWFWLLVLGLNDEPQQPISYRVLTFPFTGTLILALAAGLLQSFGFLVAVWFGVAPLIVIFWSLSQIPLSWRYR